ncbi:YraN family protein [bacterium]|nr:YraN family protein [bacterium]
MDSRKKFGNEGEAITAAHLEKKGFTILHRNYQKLYGEIDLIAQKKDLLVFVEVKRRKHAYFDMNQLITVSKQKKIIMVANEYITRYAHDQKICRFDVALIEGETFTYLPNAFTQGEYSESF